MEWIQVESSQIACLGYEPEAEYPLGVKFTPTKKQAAAGQTGSVYEYANVTPQLFAEFLGAKQDPLYDNSIGVFFAQRIKSHPDLYPFRKVENVEASGMTGAIADFMDEHGIDTIKAGSTVIKKVS